DWQEQVDQRKAEEVYVSGGAGTRPDALITKIGAGAASSLLGILQSLAVGQISKEQAVTILVSIYGLTEDDAAKIATQSSIQQPDDQKQADQQINPAELTSDLTESASMQAQVEIVQPKVEAFTMKDDPDFTLSDKEADMVAKAIGLKNKPAKKKKV
ncbi:MAG: hypothetical protein EBT13_17890, partial [Rhodobacteraceae bacterium]|nr:hypothetical protein [Paracoccaceae bacterium]